MTQPAFDKSKTANFFKPIERSVSQTLSEVPSDNIIRFRIRYGNSWTACYGLLGEYSKASSIHGIRYIFEIHRPLYEKVLWIVMVMMSFYAAFSLIRETYMKWLDAPVVMAFDESFIPIHEIPFPTVTICPEIKTATDKFDFTQISQQVWSEIQVNNEFNNLANISKADLKNFVGMLQICEDDVLNSFAPYLSHDLHDMMAQRLVDLMPEHNDTLLYARWSDRFYVSPALFKYVLTEEGVCHQFNGLTAQDMYRDPSFLSYEDKTEVDFDNYFDKSLSKLNEIRGSWSLEKGYVGQGLNSYPQRTVSPSYRNALTVVLMGFERNFEQSCRRYKQGYKVFINSPESVIQSTSHYALVPHDHEVLISIMPVYVTATANLRSIDSEKRQCYFNDERYLRFFKFYTQSNCQTECLTNFTISKCGCANFWMPKPKNISICGLADAKCSHSARDEMFMLISNQTQKKLKNSNIKIMCDCMPSCYLLKYNLEISKSYYDFEKTITAQRDTYEKNDGHAGRISIYYKERQFSAIKRSVLYSIPHLIANCGGILGLFLGISMSSIAEFLYFFTMRLFYNLSMRRKIHKEFKELANKCVLYNLSIKK